MTEPMVTRYSRIAVLIHMLISCLGYIRCRQVVLEQAPGRRRWLGFIRVVQSRGAR